MPVLQTEIDHIGIAVSDLDEALALYQRAIGLAAPSEPVEEVGEQGVRVLMVDTGSCKLEFLEPTHPDGAVARFMEKRGPGVHHIAFKVEDIRQALRKAADAGAELIDLEPRRGAGGRLVAFLHPKSMGGVLVELCQEEV